MTLQNQICLVAGLGNPGRQYRENRHNVGFMVIDELINRVGDPFLSSRSEALITDFRHNGRKIILAKPQTYMNNSGRAVRALVSYYKIPVEQIMVIYDDVDLPFETIRLRSEGGAGGQKGMKSIIRELGTRHFSRLRVGIGRPPGRMSVSNYVLQDFSTSELEVLPFILDEAARGVLTWIEEGIDQAMMEFNG
jgi:PTH1 family peptidyl-tRNA hydrolase